jgi:RNA polymerase sigma-32 factor
MPQHSGESHLPDDFLEDEQDEALSPDELTADELSEFEHLEADTDEKSEPGYQLALGSTHALSPGSSQSFEHYLRSIQQAPLLNAEQEWELARRLHEEDDLEAAQKLVFSNLRYVVHIARGYLGYGLPLPDLVQEGNIGLMKAVKRFDPTHRVRLMTFATHWVKAEINEYVIKNWQIVKMATTKAQRKLFFKLRSQKADLNWLSASEANKIAKDFNVSTKDVYQMEGRLRYGDTAFEASGDSDDDASFAPEQYLEDRRYEPEAQVLANDYADQRQAIIAQVVNQLDARSKDIIQSRWMDEDEQKMTFKDLAEKYSISIERVRQIEKMAMDKIKAQLEKLANQGE